jgi:tRNA threonylcarbamoyladenosine biosynthesis protein TsaE
VTRDAPLEMVSTSPGQTRTLGERLGRQLRAGDVVLLHGDLGAGKTTFTQGIAVGLGVVDYVQSPTFTIVSEHQGATLMLYHLDLYRLLGEADLESFGFDDYLEPRDGVSVIEWPERAANWLPDDYLLIEFSFGNGDERLLRIGVYGGFEIDLNEFEDVDGS